MNHQRTRAAARFPVSYAIFELALAHKVFAANLLREHRLYPGQELLLMLLFETGECPQSEIVELMQLDPSTVAKSLRRLENAGLVKRRSSEEDRRASIVSLTKMGMSLEKKILGVWRDLERVTVGELDAEQREQAVAIMRALEANVARAQPAKSLAKR